MNETLRGISEHLQGGDGEKVASLVRRALQENLPPKEILDGGLIAGMNVVGERFRCHDVFLPDVLLAAKAMYGGLDVLKPLLEQEGIPLRGKIVLGTVQGDLHDIGKNLVAIMLRGAGYEVIDLGRDVSPERFVAAAREQGAQMIGMSALLTTTMPSMGKVMSLLRQEGLSGSVRTIVGGAPVSSEFARQIGADAYAFDAANAVDRVGALLGRQA